MRKTNGDTAAWGELEELLRKTPVTTFEGYRVQLMALDLGIEDGLGHDGSVI